MQNLPYHENLVLTEPVKIYSDKHYYILMKLCTGGSLANEIVRRKKKYTEDEIYFIFLELISGYSVLYKSKILHLDITPRNILIHDGRYKLGDFGLSAFLNTP